MINAPARELATDAQGAVCARCYEEARAALEHEAENAVFERILARHDRGDHEPDDDYDDCEACRGLYGGGQIV